jgi:hypothetical protein
MKIKNLFRAITWKSIRKWILYILISILVLFLLFNILEYTGVCINKIPVINKILFLKRLKFDPAFSISSILEIVALCFVGWEIRSTRKNLFIDNDLKTADRLSSLIADITSRLGDRRVKIKKNEIRDEECRQKINNVLTLLSESKQDEKNLITCLNRYMEEESIYIPDWINQIRKYGDKVITNYKKIK